jgi:hypothetical protein
MSSYGLIPAASFESGVFIPSVPICMGLSASSFPRPTARSPELPALRALVEQRLKL